MVRVIEEKFGKLLCSRNPESLCDFFFTYDVFTREYFVQLHVQLDKYYVECVKCGRAFFRILAARKLVEKNIVEAVGLASSSFLLSR